MARKRKRSAGDPRSDTLRTLWPTAAEPATFAPPVDVHDDGSIITLVFDLGAEGSDGVEVELHDKTLFVLGRVTAGRDASRARRLFSFGASIDPSSVQTSISKTLLTIRIAKAGRRSIVVRQR